MQVLNWQKRKMKQIWHRTSKLERLAVLLVLGGPLLFAAGPGPLSWALALLGLALLLWLSLDREPPPDNDVAEAAADAAKQAEDLAERVAIQYERDSAPPDDLTRLSGIGGVFQTLLNEAGISTYAQLAATSVAELEAIFAAANRRRPRRLATWPRQAQFAADGDWPGLQAYLAAL